MHDMVKTLAAAIAALALLSACSNTDTVGQTSDSAPPADLTATVEQIRSQYEAAYNALPIDEPMDAEQYSILFEPIWQTAQAANISLRREALPMTDGFTLTPTEEVEPGHSLLLELNSPTQSWCLASTWVLSPDDLTPEQAARADSAEWEFIVIDGTCQETRDYVLDSFEDVDWLTFDEPETDPSTNG